jgi:hypothetical protein
MKRFRNKILLIICFLTIPLFINQALAQPPPPHPGNGVPVGGVSILAVLGILYGIFKLNKKKK